MTVFDILRDICIVVATFFVSLFIESLKNLRQLLFPTYKDLTEDVILITGAGGGLGRLLCLEFAKHCPHLIGWDINEKELVETARVVAEQGGPMLRTYVCDLRNPENIAHTATRVIQEVGRVTVLVNNAGTVSGKKLLDFQAGDVLNTFQANVLAHFQTIQSFLPTMICSEKATTIGSREKVDQVPRGHIVTVCSLTALVPLNGMTDYCSSKSAALMMSDSLELELVDSNLQDHIHITRICPFLMDTTMFAGCRSKISWLFPVVDVHYCARRIVRAVRANERLVYVYARYGLLPTLYRILPTRTMQHLLRLSGMDLLIHQLQSHQTSVASS